MERKERTSDAAASTAASGGPADSIGDGASPTSATELEHVRGELWSWYPCASVAAKPIQFNEAELAI